MAGFDIDNFCVYGYTYVKAFVFSSLAPYVHVYVNACVASEDHVILTLMVASL